MEQALREHIENQIHTIRGAQEMLDQDLAELYQVTTGRINESAKRNKNRFPNDFMFQLTQAEWEDLNKNLASKSLDSLRSQIATLKNQRGKHWKYLPYAFTEQGVTMLTTVSRSRKK
jgi:hypothetical protein